MYAGLESLQQFRHASPSGTISFSPLPSAGSPAHPQMASIFDVTKPIWTFGELTPLLALAISPDAPLASWDFLASRIIFLLRWSAIVSEWFASAAICSCVSCRDFRTALSSDSVWPSFKSHAWTDFRFRWDAASWPRWKNRVKSRVNNCSRAYPTKR